MEEWTIKDSERERFEIFGKPYKDAANAMRRLGKVLADIEPDKSRLPKQRSKRREEG